MGGAGRKAHGAQVPARQRRDRLPARCYARLEADVKQRPFAHANEKFSFKPVEEGHQYGEVPELAPPEDWKPKPELRTVRARKKREAFVSHSGDAPKGGNSLSKTILEQYTEPERVRVGGAGRLQVARRTQDWLLTSGARLEGPAAQEAVGA